MPTIASGTSVIFTIPQGQVATLSGTGTAVLVYPTSSPISINGKASIGPFDASRIVNVSANDIINYTVAIPVSGSSLTGAGVADIDFSQSIPLSSGGVSYMPPQTVTGPMAFTPMANAVRNSLVYLRLTANGTNMPTFTGFKELGSSMGYDNTNGTVNQMQFFYDGTDAYFTATQAIISAAGDTTAPVRQSAAVNGSTLVLAYNEALNTATPALNSFSYVLNGAAAVNPTAVAVSGQNVTLTFATAALQGQSATLSYTPGTNPIRDTAGNAAASFSGITVTNNTPASDTTAPVIQSAAINGANLVMTYNEALNTASPTLSSFSLSLAGGAGAAPTAAVVSGTTVSLTFAVAATNGQSAALTYTPGASAIRDVAGNNAAALTNYTVTNNTAASGSDAPLQFTADPTYYVETVDGNGDYTYTTTTAIGSGYQAVAAMSAAKSLPANTDGAFWMTASDASSLNSLIGFKEGATAPGQSVFSTWNASIMFPGVGAAYSTRVGSTSTTSAILAQSGDLYGIFRVGGAIIGRIARAAAPTVWIDVATIVASGSTAKTWPMLQAQQHPAQRTFVKPRYTGGLV